MCENKDCQHKKESPIKDWKHRCKFGPDGRRLQNGTVIVGWNDMATTHPWLAKECLDDPKSIMASTRKRIWWICKNGHKYDSLGSTRCTGTGCRYCDNKAVLPGFNDMATTHPDLAGECLDDPRAYIAGTAKILKWKCGKCGRKFKKSGVDRVNNRSRCACSMKRNKIVVRGVNDMATTHPKLARECLDDPKSVTAGTGKTLKWKCEKCGWVYPKTGAKRVNGEGCGCCSLKKVVPGINDLATTHPGLAKECLGNPTKFTAAIRKSVWWKCDKGHKYKSIVRNRVRYKVGCKYCANKKVLVGYNDMATTHPKLAKELIGNPSRHIAGTKKILKWKCSECGFKWPATGNSRSSSGTGCSKCASSGHDRSQSSFIYLVSRAGQIKYGIMNIWTGRLKNHARKGWKLLDRIEVAGWNARSLETTIRQTLRAKGVLTGRKAFREKFEGWTEAFQEVDLYVRSIRGLCRKLGIDLDAFLAA